MENIELPKELIISDKLRKMLEESTSKVAKKILEIKDVSQCPQWINYLDIAKDDATKISYVDDKRYRANYNGKKEFPEVGDIITVADNTQWYRGDHNGFAPYFGKEAVIISVERHMIENLYSETYRSYILTATALDRSFIEFVFRPKDFIWIGSKIWCPKVRYMGRCGAVVQKLLGHQDGKELGNFCDMFQATHPDFRFQIDYDMDFVKGDDIRDWYNVNKYHSESGDLGSSCMRYDICYSWLELYSKNDKLVQMFIVKDKQSGKLVSRNLVWDNKYYDRIYAISSTIASKVIKYLDSLGLKDVYDSDDNIVLDIEYGYKAFKYFPYCDTFRYLNATQISNNSSLAYDICLDNADGGPNNCMVFCELSQEDIDEDDAIFIEEIDGYAHSKYCTYSIYYCRSIIEDDAVYSKWLCSYILRKESVCLYDGEYTLESLAIELHNGKWARNNDKDVVEIKNGDYAMEDECEFSKYNNIYVLKSKALYCENIGDWIYETQLKEINEQQEVES